MYHLFVIHEAFVLVKDSCKCTKVCMRSSITFEVTASLATNSLKDCMVFSVLAIYFCNMNALSPWVARNNTKYSNILCHIMVSYVTVVAFVMTFLIKTKFTNIVIPTYFGSSTIGIFCILISIMNTLSWMIANWMKNHLVSDKNCTIVTL